MSYPVNVAEACFYLVPESRDLSLAAFGEQDGQGYILLWDERLGPVPTQEQIASVISSKVLEKNRAKESLSKLRFAHEIGGISIEGQTISTERDEIGHWYPRFASARDWLANDPATLAFNPTGMYPYKPKGGAPTGLTAAQVVRAYLCVSWFINACFVTEQYFYELIEATDGSEAQIAAVMAGVQWPQREFMWEAPE